LFRSGISPSRPAGKVARAALEKLIPAIREVLLESIEDGGSTLRDYAQPDGELGYFATRFAVYDRAGEACRCGGTVTRIAQGGRSSWYCPKCQK
jgi:formamidopyrimidine-DNA glycosylase